MGNEYEEDPSTVTGIPLGIGANTTIMNTIVDSNARVGKNCRLTNAEGIEEMVREDLGIYIRSGVMVVVENATIPDNF